MKPFLEALADGPLLVDGAMGSLLYERGVLHTRSYDELSLSQPELIRTVHADYLAAGAQVLETNTFGCNRVALARHGLAEQVTDLCRAGVEIARGVAGDRAYVAGAVGPTGVGFGVATAAERRTARFALAEQIDTLVVAGVDVIMLETFGSILELEVAVEVAKERGPRVPVVAQLVFDAAPPVASAPPRSPSASSLPAPTWSGPTAASGPPSCQVGVGMVGRGKPVIIQPNAGLPAAVEGRTLYVANPEHFGVFARRMLKSGVRLIGGCCGTTPAHTRAMLGAVRMMGGHTPTDGPEAPPTAPGPARVTVVAAPPPAKVPLPERSRLAARLAAGEFVVSVELTAPAGTDLAKVTADVEALHAGGVDVVNIADGPRASARMSNLAVCASLRATTGAEPILHVCARDRSFLGLVAHLLGAQGLGVRNLVCITGDPPKMGDYPFSTPVYDVDSIGLLRIAAGLNGGVDPAGKELEASTSFLLATGAEPGAHDYERELRRLEEKRDAGAELVMTQPVYDPRTLERFLADARPLGLPIMVGLLPLASHRNAEFLHHEVPGMSIPAEFRARMAKVGSGPAARAEGVRIAQEALTAVKDAVAGAYIMPPFNRVDAALAVLEPVRDRLPVVRPR
ncbi:MAG: bifunctional homocysteine S-methyltransferase/methylenetetrahydrofolate reductase [Kofleriaceae bacterium]